MSFHERTFLTDGGFLSGAIKGNLVIAVGYVGNKACVVGGKR